LGKLGVALVIAGPATAADESGTARPIPDPELAAAVDRRFSRDPDVPFDAIDVSAANGIVSLSGTVPHLWARDRAVQVARQTRGVRGLIDRLKVRLSGRTDQEIQDAARAALRAEPAVAAAALKVRVADGVVTLTGTTRSGAEQFLAGEVLRGVAGVRDVVNQIIVRPVGKRTDEDLAADIRARLRFDRRVDAGQIDVRVKNGEVTLSGTVGSAAERWQAYSDAWVTGVTGVDHAELEVERWWDRAALRGREEVSPADSEVQVAIREALRQDPRVQAHEVSVSVIHGVATLTGVVESFPVKWAAADDARNTVGVNRVRDYLKVRGTPKGDDAMIVRAVQAALAADPAFEAGDVGVRCFLGRVYLMGRVDSRYQVERATDLARRVPGVVDVKNLLLTNLVRSPGVYQRPPSIADAELNEEIVDELRWSPRVDAARVYVHVRDGVAILTGTVTSEGEREAAERAAWQGGARQVVNELTVGRRGR
jgi:osmotically-inducible protein OsmY